MTTTHLITGVAGQDGVLLARHLRARGERVIGTVRPGGAGRLACYLEGIELIELDVRDVAAFRSVVLEHRPATVFNLAALSSVGASWDDPAGAMAVNRTAVEQTVAMLADLGEHAPGFVQASSSEIFGPPEDGETVTDETCPLNPVSPYGEAKAAAHLAVAAAREAGLRASNLVLFGHTSPLQTDDFVLASISHQAAEVSLGLRPAVALRNPAVRRDWCSAYDVAQAFAAAATGPAGDYVIASGHLHGLSEIGRWALEAAGVPGEVTTAPGDTLRPNDFDGRVGDARHALESLGWRARTPLREEIARMVAVNLTRLRTGRSQDQRYL